MFVCFMCVSERDDKISIIDDKSNGDGNNNIIIHGIYNRINDKNIHIRKTDVKEIYTSLVLICVCVSTFLYVFL